MKADLEVALIEIHGLHEFINKQNMESSLLESQLEGIKNKEAELLKMTSRQRKRIGKS